MSALLSGERTEATVRPPSYRRPAGHRRASPQRTESVARGGAIGMVGAVASTIGGFALVWVAGRWLGAATAGVVFAATALFTVLSNSAKLGADTALVRFASSLYMTGRQAALRPLLRTALGPATAVSVGVAVVLLAGSQFWAQVLYADLPPADGVPYIALSAVFLPLATITLLLLALMRGLGKVTPFVGVEQVLKPVSRPLLLIAFLVAGGGGLAFLVSWLVPVAVGLLIATVVVVRRLATVPRPTRQTQVVGGREFWGFAGPRALAGVLEICGPWVGVLFLSAMVSSSSAASFTAVTRIAMAGGVVMLALRLALSPHLAAAFAVGDLDRVRRLHLSCTSWAVLASWPFFLLVAVYAAPVLGLFGGEFRNADTALVLVCVANLVNLAVGNAQSAVLMSGKSAWNLHSTAAALTTQVVVGLVAVPRWGVAGAGLAFAAGMVVDNVWAFCQVRFGLGLRIWSGELTIAVLTTVIASAAGVGVSQLAGAQGLLGGVLSGVVAMLLVGVVIWRRRDRLLAEELLTAFGVHHRGHATGPDPLLSSRQPSHRGRHRRR
jgi:O-antigen/teichoic acid export membrane protein